MFLTRIRKEYEQKTLIVGEYCAKISTDPNVFTIFGTICGLLAGVCFWKTYFLTGIAFGALSGVSDMIDGAVARYLHKQHPYGTVFDRVNDRYVELFMVMGCMASGHVHPVWAMFSLFGAIMASYTRACAESAGKVKNCAVGYMERQEKTALILVGLLFEPVLNPHGLLATSLHPFPYPLTHGVLLLQFMIIIIGLFSHYTVYQRLMYARDHENDA